MFRGKVKFGGCSVWCSAGKIKFRGCSVGVLGCFGVVPRAKTSSAAVSFGVPGLFHGQNQVPRLFRLVFRGCSAGKIKFRGCSVWCSGVIPRAKPSSADVLGLFRGCPAGRIKFHGCSVWCSGVVSGLFRGQNQFSSNTYPVKRKNPRAHFGLPPFN